MIVFIHWWSAEFRKNQTAVAVKTKANTVQLSCKLNLNKHIKTQMNTDWYSRTVTLSPFSALLHTVSHSLKTHSKGATVTHGVSGWRPVSPNPPIQIFSFRAELLKMSGRFVKACMAWSLSTRRPVTDVIRSRTLLGFTADPENWTENIHASVLGGPAEALSSMTVIRPLL